MSRGLSIEIDGRGVEALAVEVGATERQIQAALRSTYGRMGRWMKTVSLRGLSRELRIPQKILRSRVRTFRMQGGVFAKGEGVKVWYGLRGIPLISLRARATGRGVSAAGGRSVPGAFIARYRGKRHVLKREGSGRLPIKIQFADIGDKATVYIEDEIIGSAAFDAQFYKLLGHELKWRTRSQ